MPKNNLQVLAAANRQRARKAFVALLAEFIVAEELYEESSSIADKVEPYRYLGERLVNEALTLIDWIMLKQLKCTRCGSVLHKTAECGFIPSNLRKLKVIRAKRKNLRNAQKPGLKLFIWYDFAPDYTSGLAFAIAHSEEAARRMVIKAYGPNPSNWGELIVYSLKKPVAACVGGGG